MAPAGEAAPRSRTLFGGEDCLSEASSAALTFGTGAKAPPWGHARAPMVLGPFAETKGTSSCGDETPQEPLPFCHSRKFLAGIQSRSLCFCLSSPTPIGDPVVGAASHAARRGRQETDSAMRWRRYEDHSLPVVVGAPFDAVNGRRHEMPPLQRKGLRRHSRARLRKRGR